MHPIFCLGILLTLILSLPVFGVFLAGYAPPPHLTIFPIATEPGEASIVWLIWGSLATLITASLAPIIWRLSTFSIATEHASRAHRRFPGWGWIALLWIISAWVLAWTRVSWFQTWQHHTFPLLWFGYIAVLNALTVQRSGQCLLLHRPRFFGRLFFLSAGFWWTFEYLNQFVNNWHYHNLPDTDLIEYIVHTSIAFSTVLPAVLSTYEWLGTFPRLTIPFESWCPIPWLLSPNTGWLLLALGSIGLSLIGIWPMILFPVLWISPFFILFGIQLIQKKHMRFMGLEKGDWRPVILSSLAALICGFWWELWNVYSLSHWEYTIPYGVILESSA